jgi:hypothetical protein
MPPGTPYTVSAECYLGAIVNGEVTRHGWQCDQCGATGVAGSKRWHTSDHDVCFECYPESGAGPPPHRLKHLICSTCNDTLNRNTCPACEPGGMNPCKQCVDACLYSVQGYQCADGCTGCFTRAQRVGEMVEYAWDVMNVDYDDGCRPDTEWAVLGGVITPGARVCEAKHPKRTGTVVKRDEEFVWVLLDGHEELEPYQSGMHEDDDEPVWELRLVGACPTVVSDDESDGDDSDVDVESLNDHDLARDPGYNPWDEVEDCDSKEEAMLICVQRVLHHLAELCDQEGITLLQKKYLAFLSKSPLEKTRDDLFSLFVTVEEIVTLLRQYVGRPDLHAEPIRSEFKSTMQRESESEEGRESYVEYMRLFILNTLTAMIKRSQ